MVVSVCDWSNAHSACISGWNNSGGKYSRGLKQSPLGRRTSGQQNPGLVAHVTDFRRQVRRRHPRAICSSQFLINAGTQRRARRPNLYNPQTARLRFSGSSNRYRPSGSAARLMATVINVIAHRKLTLGSISAGRFPVIAVELLGSASLSFAVGFYIPMATHARHLLPAA